MNLKNKITCNTILSVEFYLNELLPQIAKILMNNFQMCMQKDSISIKCQYDKNGRH